MSVTVAVVSGVAAARQPVAGTTSAGSGVDDGAVKTRCDEDVTGVMLYMNGALSCCDVTSQQVRPRSSNLYLYRHGGPEK